MGQPIQLPPPILQIDFYQRLQDARRVFLQQGLSETVGVLDLTTLNSELSRLVPPASLKALARGGLRGELVFPVPCLLRNNPRLLAYYRLVLGFSQKEFYGRAFGLSGFKPMEERGRVSPAIDSRLQSLCEALVQSAVALVDGIGCDQITSELLDDLSLLTLGPQLRGGANVRRGAESIVAVFGIIRGIVGHVAHVASPARIEILNAAGRNVKICFGSDPDIVVLEQIATSSVRNVIAIEVKGGQDFSNIHNRVGEAEKSHQKAKAAGYVECWTVVNVVKLDEDMARRESPSTNRFYLLSELQTGRGPSYEDFRDRFVALTGIKSA